ncbi:hypothetical protein LSAT2_015640 [Lamellibrachia satsuma]|nr:hypothetical protein LSAT2_015640 [Lamellibrachia satsuma]
MVLHKKQEARDLIKLDIHGKLLSNRALIEASKKASPEAKDGETRTTGPETSFESIKSNFDSESADRSSTLHDEVFNETTSGHFVVTPDMPLAVILRGKSPTWKPCFIGSAVACICLFGAIAVVVVCLADDHNNNDAAPRRCPLGAAGRFDGSLVMSNHAYTAALGEPNSRQFYDLALSLQAVLDDAFVNSIVHLYYWYSKIHTFRPNTYGVRTTFRIYMRKSYVTKRKRTIIISPGLLIEILRARVRMGSARVRTDSIAINRICIDEPRET